jgi:4-hydroxy-4-methyl-2-oxoglutarate aldolase
MTTSELREQALGAGSATVHEAMGRSGALPARIKPVFAGSVVAGPAFPIRASAGDNLWIHHGLYAAQPGDVLVVEVPVAPDYGYWGEILSVAAQQRGLGGLVITGGVRDIDALARVGFPVFSSTVCIRGTGKDPNSDGGFGAATPLRIGDVDVRHGDYVVGDADGVAVVPAAEIARVVALADRRRVDEDALMARIRDGETTLTLLDLPEVAHR